MEINYSEHRHAIHRAEYAFVATPFGEMLTAWCQPFDVDPVITLRNRTLCFASFTKYLGREQVLAELQRLIPFASLQEGNISQDITTIPPHSILLIGSRFQIDVWRALLTVEKGETITYGSLAALANHPTAVRATASSVGRNPISVIVPCHRVLLASGGVGNYHSGAAIKRELLEWEGALP